ncbi:MAG: beta-glucuronidase [Clostridia bacterium]|nr:beta-glucuronidase [Clostridia bacterium]
MLYPKINHRRDVYNLNGVWEYAFVEEDYLPTAMNPNGKPMAVPASYNEILTDMNMKEYSGKVLYEREFAVPKREDCLYRLRIGATSHKCEVYLNSEKIGEGINGFYPIDLPLEGLKEQNRLSIVIDNRLTAQTFPNGRIKNGKQLIQHDFYNYTGIHRDVLVYTLPKQHIDDVVIRTVVDGDYGKVSVEVRGEYKDIRYRVLNERGEEVVCSKENVFQIPDPVRWEVLNSYLYTLIVETDTDQYEEKFGIRKVEIKGTQFLVNDKPVYFKGFGMHEDFFVLGKGNNPAVTLRNFECMKWINANSFRTSHYPYSEEVLDLADRYGFLVIDEAPAAGLVLWEECFGENGANEETLAIHKELMKRLYERDKNHPCVVMVSVSNEPQTTEKNSEKYFEEVFAYTRKFWEVPVTLVEPSLGYAHNSCVAKFSDVICVNRYLGWYTNHGDLTVIEEKLTKDLTDFYEKYKKPVILSEFGADTIEGLHTLPAEGFSEDFQTFYIAENCKVLDKLDFCIGEHVWNFADFKTQQTTGRVRGNRKGVFTKERQPKMAAYYLKERWKNK